MSQPKAHIVYCECPNHHTLLAFAFLPGVTEKQMPLTPESGNKLTIENACAYMMAAIRKMVAEKTIYSTCPICHASLRKMKAKLETTTFDTIEEAEAHLAQSTLGEQALAQFLSETRN